MHIDKQVNEQDHTSQKLVTRGLCVCECLLFTCIGEVLLKELRAGKTLNHITAKSMVL